MSYNYIGVDLETTGTTHELHVPIQIGVALDTRKLYRSLIGGWDWDKHEWSEESFEIHGIPRDAVDHAPTASEVDAELSAWLTENAGPGTKIMVGWNVGAFDRPYIEKWLPITASMFIRRTLDLNAACYVLEKKGVRNPDTLKRHAKVYADAFLSELGVTVNRHDAGYDAMSAVVELQYLRSIQ